MNLMMLLAQAAPSGLVEKSAGGFETILSMVMIPVIGIGIVLAVLLLLKKMAKLYYKVPPNKALVVFGRGVMKIITGGAKLLIPFFMDWFEMDLSAFQVELQLKNAPNKDKVPINVRAVATVCIGEDEELLANASRKFGSKPLNEIREIAHATLEGQFRQVISQTDMDTILSRRSEFNATTQETAGKELAHLGFKLLMLNIQEVTDDQQYIKAQGDAEIAKVKADAAIKTEEQKRREVIETTNAKREAEKTRADNEAQMADANRDLNKRKAIYDAEVATEQAKASQAGPLATAVASKAVKVATVDAEEAETVARIKLQDQVAALTEAELKATVIKKAEADARSLAIVADGVKQKQIIEANAAGEARNIEAKAGATAAALEAEAEAAKITKVGTAKAEMTALTGQADADAKKANLLAEADGETAKAAARKALLLAEADGAAAQAEATKALLIAQADGARKLNEAYFGLTPEQRQLFMLTKVMEMSPAIIAAIGEAGAKVTAELAQAMTAAYGSVGSVSIYDTGNGNGKGALDRWTQGPGDFLFRLITGLKQSGTLAVASGILKQATGVDLEQLVNETALPTIDATATAVTGEAESGGNGPVTKKDKGATARS